MMNPDIEKRRILFVDDDEDAHELVTLMLPNYSVSIARDYYEGLRLARQRYFDLYILDNRLPNGSGVELCRSIREFDPHTPILFYSAVAYDRDVREALSASAQTYIAKPSDPDELQRAIARLTLASCAMALEARLAEITTVREELAIRYREDTQNVEKAKEKYLHAEKKALKAKARHAFLVAMGTRGDFARLWPSIYLREFRRRSALTSEDKPST